MARSPRKHLLRAADELDAFLSVVAEHADAAAMVAESIGAEGLGEVERVKELIRGFAGRFPRGGTTKDGAN